MTFIASLQTRGTQLAGCIRRTSGILSGVVEKSHEEIHDYSLHGETFDAKAYFVDRSADGRGAHGASGGGARTVERRRGGK
jgi:hypothetical protein